MWIIPPFNILKDSEFGLAMIGEAFSVYQLALKGSKEAFTQGIVKTIANRSNRGSDPHFCTALTKGIRGVLRPLV